MRYAARAVAVEAMQNEDRASGLDDHKSTRKIYDWLKGHLSAIAYFGWGTHRSIGHNDFFVSTDKDIEWVDHGDWVVVWPRKGGGGERIRVMTNDEFKAIFRAAPEPVGG
jgi:hypothetical protein